MPRHDPRTSDLDRRWRLARAAALSGVVGPGVDPLEDEPWAISLAMSAASEATLRLVYDNGRRLGLGFARFHGGPVASKDLRALLGGLTSPCLRGAWAAEPNDALCLRRAKCADAERGTCDFWREALSGLIHGLTEDLIHVRHASPAGGGDCLDVVHGDPEGPWRFAALDADLASRLEAAQVTLRVLAPGVRVVFKGALEGVVQYERLGEGCGPEAMPDAATFDAILERFAPGTGFRDISPRAVLDHNADATATAP